MLSLRFRKLMTPLALLLLWCQASTLVAIGPSDKKAERASAVRRIPLDRLTPAARQRVEAVISKPTMFRRLPSQAMDCDQDMFLFLVRHPEVMVGIWDVMGITKVSMKRTGPFNVIADDGQGTTCQIDLVYGDSQVHLFYARGKYDGPMVAKPITGSGIFVLHSDYARGNYNRTTIGGQMDVFLKLDSLGADLVVRTLGPLIGKSADHNFVETAKFITQVSQASEVNPVGIRRLGMKLPFVSDSVRQRFITIAQAVGDRRIAIGQNATGQPPRSASELSKGTTASSSLMNLQRALTSEASDLNGQRVPQASLSQNAVSSVPAIAQRNPVRPQKRSMNLRR